MPRNRPSDTLKFQLGVIGSTLCKYWKLFLENLDDLKATAGKASGYSQTLKVVDAAHSENSTMYLMVLGGRDAKPTPIKGPEGQALGPQMPQGGTPLTEQQRADLKGWICAGAK